MTRRTPIGAMLQRGVDVVVHRRRAVIVCALLAGYVVAAGLGVSRVRYDTAVASFLPPDNSAIAAIDAKATRFGGDPIVVLLQTRQKENLFDDADQLSHLLRLEGSLATLPDVAAVYGPATVLNQIAKAAQTLLADIGGKRQAIRNAAAQLVRTHGASPKQIVLAENEAEAAFDARYGSLLVGALPVGLPTLHNANFVQTVIFDANGQPRTQWRNVVPSPTTATILVRPRQGVSAAVSRRIAASVAARIGSAGLKTEHVTITGLPVVEADFERQVRNELPLLGALALIGCSIVLVLIPWRRRRVARLFPVAVTALGAAGILAVFGWTDTPVSLGILALLPILLGVGSDFPVYVVHGEKNLRAVVVTALASAVGAATLWLTPIPIVADLGLALAAGIVFILLLALAFRAVFGAEPAAPPATVTGARSTPLDALARVSALPRRARWSALAAFTALAVAGLAMLPGLSVQANPESLADGLPSLHHAVDVRDLLHYDSELSVVVTGPDVLAPEVLTWGQRAENAIIAGYGNTVRAVLTTPDLLRFLGADPTEAQIRAAMDLLPTYLTSAVIGTDRTESLMIFGTTLGDVSQQQALQRGIRRALPTPPKGVHVSLVGLPVAAVDGYTALSGDRYLTMLSGIAAAGVVLLLGLRRRDDAVRAILAGVLATGWGLLLLRAFGGSLSPLTVTLGSLTTVCGCEFAVFHAHAVRTRSQGLFRGVLVAGLTSAVGYLVLVASGLTALREFGLLLAGSVVLAYAAALVVVTLAPPRPPRPGKRTSPKSQLPVRRTTLDLPDRATSPTLMEVAP